MNKQTHDTVICCLYDNDRGRLKVKGWRNIFHVNTKLTLKWLY